MADVKLPDIARPETRQGNNRKLTSNDKSTAIFIQTFEKGCGICCVWNFINLIYSLFIIYIWCNWNYVLHVVNNFTT